MVAKQKRVVPLDIVAVQCGDPLRENSHFDVLLVSLVTGDVLLNCVCNGCNTALFFFLWSFAAACNDNELRQQARASHTNRMWEKRSNSGMMESVPRLWDFLNISFEVKFLEKSFCSVRATLSRWYPNMIAFKVHFLATRETSIITVYHLRSEV